MAVRAPLQWRSSSHAKKYQMTQKPGILRHSECWSVIKVESCIIWILSSNNYYNSVCINESKALLLLLSCKHKFLCVLASFKMVLGFLKFITCRIEGQTIRYTLTKWLAGLPLAGIFLSASLEKAEYRWKNVDLQLARFFCNSRSSSNVSSFKT